jgi:hypothetical protein
MRKMDAFSSNDTKYTFGDPRPCVLKKLLYEQTAQNLQEAQV